MKYDITILSCEGNSFEDEKPMQFREAVYEYASLGGRVFASHWHNVWFADGPPPVPTTQLPGVVRVQSTLALRTVKKTTALPV